MKYRVWNQKHNMVLVVDANSPQNAAKKWIENANENMSSCAWAEVCGGEVTVAVQYLNSWKAGLATLTHLSRDYI